jgi:general secretion pathway protein J
MEYLFLKAPQRTRKIIPPYPHLVKGGRGDCQKGFTLLELTISIAMIGIIVLIIVGAMRLGLRSIDSGEKRIEYLERIRSSLNIIDSQIQSQIPINFSEDGLKKYYFKGDKESLQFSTNYSIWGGQKGYVMVTYRVVSDNSGKQVLYTSENVIGLNNNREVKLSDAFDMIYFEYFYKDPTEEEGKWMEQWADDVNIPEKLRLHFVEGTKDLTMIIPVRVRELLQ